MAKTKTKGIRQRKDGRYEWRFTYNGVAFSGYADNERLAKQAMKDRRYEVENGLFSKESSLSLDAWFTKWIETYKVSDCKESTLNYYRNTYKRYISPVFGSKKIKSLTADQIQRFTNQKAKDFSGTTASTINFLMYDCLRQAARLKLINQNPMDNTTPPKFRKTKKKRALTKEQVDLFLEYSKDSSYYPIFRTATLSGMRIGEILGLPWENVDFENREITISQTLCYTSAKGQYLDTPKSEMSNRTIPMADELYPLLKQCRTEQNKQKLHMGQYWQPVEGMENLVFLTKTGRPHSDSNIRKLQKLIIEEMRQDGHEIEDFTLHTLRHCFATRCIEAGMNPRTLQEIMGHSTLNVTMDLYVDVMKDVKIREMRKVQSAL